MTAPGTSTLIALPGSSRRAATGCSPDELAEAAELLAVEVLGPRWLAAAFDELNAAAFDGELPRPRFRLADLPGWFGAFEAVPGTAGTLLVDTGVLAGRHPSVRPGRAFAAGRRMLAADVVAHEATHARLAQVAGDPGGAHGPLFLSAAAGIAAAVGLPAPATTAEAGFWPVGLCPPGRYLGALINTGGSR